MVIVSHALPGNLLTILLISFVMIALATSQDQLRSPMDRMSLAFGVAHKPYTTSTEKPKKPKVDKYRDHMAIAKYSGVGIVGMSGKIQGTVFLNNNVVRVWHKTKTVRDTATNLVKGILSGVSTAYRALSASQIAGWVQGASFAIRKNQLAEVKSLTGNQFYQRVNNILLSLGVAGTDDAPGVAVPTSLTALLGLAAAGADTFTVAMNTIAGPLAALPANTYARFYATRQVGISKSRFSKSDYRLVGTFAPATAGPLNVKTDYEAAFGALVAAQRIGYSVELVTWDATANLFAVTGKIYGDTIVAA